jgi:hypothetical protein
VKRTGRVSAAARSRRCGGSRFAHQLGAALRRFHLFACALGSPTSIRNGFGTDGVHAFASGDRGFETRFFHQRVLSCPRFSPRRVRCGLAAGGKRIRTAGPT